MTNNLVHGSWSLSVNNNILLQTFSGAWNKEAAIAYIKDFRETTQPLIHSPWAILSVFEDWELCTPDLNPLIIEHCQWFIEHGCSKDCHVYSPDGLKQLVLDQIIPYEEPGYERRVFSNMDDAISWLATQQFPLANTAYLRELISPSQ